MARAPISDDLAAQVMFASDRTCCLCRLEKHKLQIHHIDENPSNNDFANLAVVCLHCHSDVHTAGGFVRNLTPELVRLYNSSWRDMVRLRLVPSDGTPGRRELIAEALLEASLDCHYWKVFFMSVRGAGLPGGMLGEFVDVWDLMTARWIPEYSPSAFQQYYPLFDAGLREVQQRFDRLVQLFPDVLPYSFRTELVRARRQLEVERAVYVSLPSIASPEQAPSYFIARFAGVVRVLAAVARDADKRRKAATETIGLDA